MQFYQGYILHYCHFFSHRIYIRIDCPVLYYEQQLIN